MRQIPTQLEMLCLVLAVAWAAAADGADPDPAVSAWSTGGASATAKPTDGDGKPVTGAVDAAQSPLPYWQAPALPTAVIQGGAIPTGWQPQAVPYQGIGPDGRPVTMYFAPTYVFTYQAGPPVLAAPQPVERRRTGRVMRPGVTPNPYTTNWNYATRGATPVAPSLPPATVARYAPQPYRFPSDARALSGTPITPPAATVPAPPPQVWGAAPAPTSPPSAPWSQPPTGWSAASPVAAPPPMAPSAQGFVPQAPAFVPQAAAALPPPGAVAAPTTWVSAPPPQVPAAPPFGVPPAPSATVSVTAPGAPPPTASLSPPVPPPIPAVPPATPQPIPAS